ncbi:hypothetical protein Poly30_53640 [Planctomycetes bacterium Poly30]|uniref:Right handed beta helix domain-containing protein n=1 Tax=Saltatorellus ferox TaxID=2528018 RepID=A0A518F0E2_9BACT|nr:hypothetical protein Poly30_53640 [Planctomycetes bacterium Poly30]
MIQNSVHSHRLAWLAVLPLLAVCGSSKALALQLDSASEAPGTLRPEYVPGWNRAPVQRELNLLYDPAMSETDNGDRLKDQFEALLPGDLLRVGPGRWSVNSFFQVDLQGTAAAPIRIIGEPGAILTRPNEWQNAINFGSTTAAATSYLLFRGFEVTNGSYGIRLQNVDNLWIDQCHVHGVRAVGIGANSHHTNALYVTRCEVHDTASTGEGMYLGGNNASAICSNAVIALNHVHDTGGSQGDGIELKQGSHGCLIAENLIHGTNYPGLLVYGTDGNPVNIIESNVIWDTVSNPFQVQGEAIVRNNLIFAANSAALQSGPHQDATTNLKIIGNTFIARGSEAAFLRSWGGKPGMVLANNVFYCEAGEAVHVNGGLAGVVVASNVALGPVWGIPMTGFSQGAGLSDFIDVTWDGTHRDARPTGQSALNRPTLSHPDWTRDLTGAIRPLNPRIGALEPGTYGRYLGFWTPTSPRLRTRFPLVAGMPSYSVTVEGAPPFSSVWLGSEILEQSAVGGTQQGSPIVFRAATTDATGRAVITLDPALLPTNPGDSLQIRAMTRTPSGPLFTRRMIATAK